MNLNFKEIEEEVKVIFNKVWRYNQYLNLMNEDENYYPYQSANLIKEKSTSYGSQVSNRLEKVDRYTCYINKCIRVIELLDQDSKTIMTRSFLKKEKRWWDETYMSNATYYRKRRKAIHDFYTLYIEI